eukprot:COSAG01_NODE_3260_length_6337_cov_11.824784_3_plen_895_part_00
MLAAFVSPQKLEIWLNKLLIFAHQHRATHPEAFFDLAEFLKVDPAVSEPARASLLPENTTRADPDPEVARIAEERRVAEEQAAAEAQAARIAEERRVAEEQAAAEAEAARIAEERRVAEEQAAAEADAARIAEERRVAEEQAAAVAQAARIAEERRVAEEQAAAEADAARIAEERRVAEEQAAAEVQAARIAEERRVAEEQAAAEAEAARIAEERRVAKEQAVAEADVARIAEERRVAEEQAAAEAEAARIAEERRVVEEKAAAEIDLTSSKSTPGKDKYWKDMTTQEQQACVQLGWTPESWDAADDSPMHRSWASLQAEGIEHWAIAMGWTDAMGVFWDRTEEGEWPSPDSETSEEEEAAQELEDTVGEAVLDEQAAAKVLRMNSVDFSESEAPGGARVEAGHPGPIFYDPQKVGEEFAYQTAETADALQELIGQGTVRPATQVYVSEWDSGQWFPLEEKWEELGVDLSPASAHAPLPAQESPIDAIPTPAASPPAIHQRSRPGPAAPAASGDAAARGVDDDDQPWSRAAGIMQDELHEAGEAEEAIVTATVAAAPSAREIAEEAAALTRDSGQHGDGTGITMAGIQHVLEHVLADRGCITAETTTSDLFKAHVLPVTMPIGWTKSWPQVTNAANSWYTHHYIEDATGQKRLKANGTDPDPPPGTYSLCAKLAATPATAHFIGRPTHFVSHAHTYKALEFIDALKNFVDTLEPGEAEQVFFWIDGFSIDEHQGFYGNKAEDNSEQWADVFKQAIQKMGNTVMVMSPWSDPVVLTRMWCLWEMYCTVATESTFHVCLGPAEQQELEAALLKDHTVVVEAFRKGDGIDVEKAEAGAEAVLRTRICRRCCHRVAEMPVVGCAAGSEEDRAMIHGAVRGSVGFDALNVLAKKQLREW